MEIIKDLIALVSCNIIYFTYIELNPHTSGIVFRYNDKNEKYLSLSSIREFIIFPYKNQGLAVMWKPCNWDINHTVVISGLFGLYKLIF